MKTSLLQKIRNYILPSNTGRSLGAGLVNCGIAAVIMAAGSLTSCKEEIDESNLYTFTGETIEDYLANRSDQYSSFNQILTRIGYDKILAAYGKYTCFAPNNEAIAAYVDSLYADNSNKDLPRNGMTAPGIEGLTDSLCRDIALFHLLNSKQFSVNMGNGMTIRTILGRDINTKLDTITHNVMINRDAQINPSGMDIELENGVLHEIDHVITRSNSLISGELAANPDFSIFAQAMQKTGLMDSLTRERNTDYTIPENASIYKFYVPEECQIGFTILAETNAALQAQGINSWDELAEYANTIYGKSAVAKDETNKEGWYDYYRNHGITVSTGGDYENANNALNMYMRYHILKCKVPYDNLTYRYNEYSGMTRFEYYETMLPYTLLKVMQVSGKRLINRWIANNTLTDRVGLLGTTGMHSVMREGIEILNDQIAAKNGYIHPINGVLVYDWDVPNGVLNERLRFDDASLFPEMMSNSFRLIKDSLVNAMNGGVKGRDPAEDIEGVHVLGGDYIRIPSGYCENLAIYNDATRLYYLPGQENTWSNYQGDEFNCKGKYDFAMRLPPVPDGTYELRMGYTANGNRGMLQFYLGTSSDRSTMHALDIPLDMRYTPKSSNGVPDVRTGWCNPKETDDAGVASDISMRNLGYMRGPLFYTYGAGKTQARYNAEDLRRILTKQQFTQGEYWLRFKSVIDADAEFHLDYIEFCPEYIYNNTQYVEDMY